MLEKYLQAAEIHKQVRQEVKSFLKPNIKIIDLCEFIESSIRKKAESYPNQINNCIAFPTGICLNNIAAHYTPRYNEETIIGLDDVCKIDFGTHVDGHIIDSAFTINFSEKYINLLMASKEAVHQVIKNIGVDMKFKELSAISQEIVESYELEVDNKIVPLKPIDNISGHNILPWKIHGDKRFFSKINETDNQVVEEGDVLAIEVFVSTGSGTTILSRDLKNYSHYNICDPNKRIPLFKNKKTNSLAKKIIPYFSTLPFCNRYIDFKDNKKENYLSNLQELFREGILNSYPPLIEKDSRALISQFEDTVYVNNQGCINLSEVTLQ